VIYSSLTQFDQSPSAYAIETEGLTKAYGTFEAVRDLSIKVPFGSITGFLGQNGAGKSTTIKMLLGMMKPSRGIGRVLDIDVTDPVKSIEARRRLAYVSEDKRLYDYMTVAQIIEFTRAFYPTWKTDVERRLLDEFRLPLDRMTKKLSKGMRTQTALLLALARGSELLILDEPTEGLDPVVTEKVLELVVGAAADGATVFFSSHQIAEVEQIADRILLIDRGRLVLDTSPEAIAENFRRVRAVYDTPLPHEALALDGVERVDVDGRMVTVIASHNAEAIAQCMVNLSPTTGVEILPLSLKEVVLESLKRR